MFLIVLPPKSEKKKSITVHAEKNPKATPCGAMFIESESFRPKSSLKFHNFRR